MINIKKLGVDVEKKIETVETILKKGSGNLNENALEGYFLSSKLNIKLNEFNYDNILFNQNFKLNFQFQKLGELDIMPATLKNIPDMFESSLAKHFKLLIKSSIFNFKMEDEITKWNL